MLTIEGYNYKKVITIINYYSVSYYSVTIKNRETYL